jgi:asparagine synthase (glutamine-hydrolysing)
VREPLMDHELVEWLATLPSRFKAGGAGSKLLLKKTMEGRLPPEVMHRPKMGFSVPLARWLRGPLRVHMQSVLAGKELADTGMFNPAALKRLADEHLAGTRDHSTPIWTVLMFEAFLRCVLEGSPARFAEAA